MPHLLIVVLDACPDAELGGFVGVVSIHPLFAEPVVVLPEPVDEGGEWGIHISEEGRKLKLRGGLFQEFADNRNDHHDGEGVPESQVRKTEEAGHDEVPQEHEDERHDAKSDDACQDDEGDEETRTHERS